jgi:DNA-binding transcriptional ArsR family regulator
MDSFTALSDASRRSIIVMLAENGEMNVAEIGERFHFTAPALTRHLKILRDANLVHMEKRKQQRVYRVDREGLCEMEEWMIQVNRFWSHGFDRLEALLREEDRKAAKAGLKPKRKSKRRKT